VNGKFLGHGDTNIQKISDREQATYSNSAPRCPIRHAILAGVKESLWISTRWYGGTEIVSPAQLAKLCACQTNPKVALFSTNPAIAEPIMNPNRTHATQVRLFKLRSSLPDSPRSYGDTEIVSSAPLAKLCAYQTNPKVALFSTNPVITEPSIHPNRTHHRDTSLLPARRGWLDLVQQGAAGNVKIRS
jgi:hypothetical protein